MQTSFKSWLCPNFSCCPKNLSHPNLGEAAAPLPPPPSICLWTKGSVVRCTANNLLQFPFLFPYFLETVSVHVNPSPEKYAISVLVQQTIYCFILLGVLALTTSERSTIKPLLDLKLFRLCEQIITIFERFISGRLPIVRPGKWSISFLPI